LFSEGPIKGTKRKTNKNVTQATKKKRNNKGKARKNTAMKTFDYKIS